MHLSMARGSFKKKALERRMSESVLERTVLLISFIGSAVTSMKMERLIDAPLEALDA
jgi:hypothetical protein